MTIIHRKMGVGLMQKVLKPTHLLQKKGGWEGGRKNPNYSNLEKKLNTKPNPNFFRVSVGSDDISARSEGKTPTTLTNASHLRAKLGCTNAKDIMTWSQFALTLFNRNKFLQSVLRK
jgi:hypothetical protein